MTNYDVSRKIAKYELGLDCSSVVPFGLAHSCLRSIAISAKDLYEDVKLILPQTVQIDYEFSLTNLNSALKENNLWQARREVKDIIRILKWLPPIVWVPDGQSS